MVSTPATIKQWSHGNQFDFTVADGTGIEKGTLLQITDPRTASISTTGGDRIAGIAAREKIASDGRTRLAIHTKGIFDMPASGAVTVGDPLMSGGYNTVKRAQSASGSSILGYALETGTDEEVIEVMLDVGGGAA